MWHFKQQPALDEQGAHGHRFVIAEELERGGYRYRSYANECGVYGEVAKRRERGRFLYEMVVQDSASSPNLLPLPRHHQLHILQCAIRRIRKSPRPGTSGALQR